MNKPILKLVSDNTAASSFDSSVQDEITYARVSVDENSSSPLKTRINTQDLYPASQELQPELARAFTLLDEATKKLDNSILAINDNDEITSDDCIQQLRMLLPELFCCRTLGDGFASVINAVHYSIENQEDKFFNHSELSVLKFALNRIKTEPFISFDEAVDEVILLEDKGFIVTPTKLEVLTDLLIED